MRRLALCTLLLAPACGPPAPRPTVVLVTLDTTRADRLSTYGYDKPTDPYLRGLAARSRVFEAAVPCATWTLPSHASMFTGLHPEEHGCWAGLDSPEGPRALSPSMPLFTTRLDSAGYHLIGAVGGPYAAAAYGFARHFDAFLDPDPIQGEFQLSGAQLNDWLFDQIDARPSDEPLFLFVNYFDAHAPYDAPNRERWPFAPQTGDLPARDFEAEGYTLADPPSAQWIEEAHAQYERELLVQDEALAALMERLEERGLLEDALVIVTSDHGEAFGENDQFGHGILPYESVARVPMVVHRAPSGPSDRVDAPISLTSVATTILAALDLPALPGARGVDLLSDRTVAATPFSEHRDPDAWFGVLRGPRYKYGRAVPTAGGEAGEHLVDLSAGFPEVLRGIEELSPDEAAAGAELRGELDRLQASWRPVPDDLASADLSEAELEALRALGYGGDDR